jgi:hypothetical protein
VIFVVLISDLRALSPHSQVWEPEGLADTSQEGNRHQHPISPYSGKELLGKTVSTIVGGKVMFLNGLVHEKPCGNVVVTR